MAGAMAVIRGPWTYTRPTTADDPVHDPRVLFIRDVTCTACRKALGWDSENLCLWQGQAERRTGLSETPHGYDRDCTCAACAYDRDRQRALKKQPPPPKRRWIKPRGSK